MNQQKKYNSICTLGITVHHDIEDGSDLTDETLLTFALQRISDVASTDGMLEAVGGALEDTCLNNATGTEENPQDDHEWQPESHWENHPEYTHDDYRHEINDNNTRLGYVDWVNSSILSALHD